MSVPAHEFPARAYGPSAGKSFESSFPPKPESVHSLPSQFLSPSRPRFVSGRRPIPRGRHKFTIHERTFSVWASVWGLGHCCHKGPNCHMPKRLRPNAVRPHSTIHCKNTQAVASTPVASRLLSLTGKRLAAGLLGLESDWVRCRWDRLRR